MKNFCPLQFLKVFHVRHKLFHCTNQMLLWTISPPFQMLLVMYTNILVIEWSFLCLDCHLLNKISKSCFRVKKLICIKNDTLTF